MGLDFEYLKGAPGPKFNEKKQWRELQAGTSSVTTPDPKQESSAHVNGDNGLKLISATILSFGRKGRN